MLFLGERPTLNPRRKCLSFEAGGQQANRRWGKKNPYVLDINKYLQTDHLLLVKTRDTSAIERE